MFVLSFAVITDNARFENVTHAYVSQLEKAYMSDRMAGPAFVEKFQRITFQNLYQTLINSYTSYVFGFYSCRAIC